MTLTFDQLKNEFDKNIDYGIFIDDSGSPGLAIGTLHPERKTWVSVIIPPFQINEVLDQIPQAIKGLEELVSAKEFHFSHIMNRQGKFKEVDLQVRLSLFRFMSYIFKEYKFPILVQTLIVCRFKN